jgi:hypothetical protein
MVCLPDVEYGGHVCQEHRRPELYKWDLEYRNDDGIVDQ